MKLKKMASKVKQETVSFFKDPKKVQGLALSIVGMVCTGLLVNEVNTSKHKKELRETSEKRFEHGLGVGYKCGNLDTLCLLNADDKISKENAIENSVDFDNFTKEQFANNDQLMKQYNDVALRNQELFESRLD